MYLFQGDELLGGIGESWTAVSHRSVGDRVLAQIGAHHLRLDVHHVEDLPIVDRHR